MPAGSISQMTFRSVGMPGMAQRKEPPVVTSTLTASVLKLDCAISNTSLEAQP